MQARSFFLVLLNLTLLSSCTIFSKSNQLEYDFETGFKHRKLLLDLPIGIVKESHDRDANGYLVRTFRYKDSASFYIACRDISSQPFILLDQSPENVARLLQILGKAGSGYHDNGSCWSRQIRDGFVIGYDFVQPGFRELYDKAIHSVRIGR